jgi:CTP synthase
MEANGLIVSGRSADNTLVEIVELADHPWFVGSQFHPEFKSRPNRPHPLFRDFIGASVHHVQIRTSNKEDGAGFQREPSTLVEN